MLNPWVIKLNLKTEPGAEFWKSGKLKASFQVTAHWIRVYHKMTYNVFCERLVVISWHCGCILGVGLIWSLELVPWFALISIHLGPMSHLHFCVCHLFSALNNSSVWGLSHTPQLCRHTFTVKGCRMNETEVAECRDDIMAALHSLWAIELDSNY